MFENLLNALKVERAGPGRAHTRPERAMADKAYSSRAIRKYLRGRGVQCVIPEKEDQKANRKRKGSTRGRPVTYDREAYKGATPSNAASTPSSNGGPWPPATTSSPSPIGQQPSCRQSSSGAQH